MSRIRLLAGACLAVFLAVTPAAAEAKPVISMSGSTSVFPLATKLAKAYLKDKPRAASFRVAQGGSDVGVADVAAGRVTIGTSSRDPKASDPGGITFYKIAKDAICLGTNPANTLPDLSQAQIQAIFSGKVKNWEDVPGATVSGPIDLVVRTAASGTQDAFQKIFMGSSKVASSAQQKASNGLVQQAVKSNKNAIGYVSLAFTEGLHDPSYKGVKCTLRDAKAGTYGGVRNFWMITRGPAAGAARAFIKWIRKSSVATKVIATEWVPLH